MTYPASEGDLVNGAAPEGEPLRAVGELLPQRLRRDQRARQDLRGERRPSPEHAIAASDAATTASTIGIIRIGIGIGATTAKGVRGRQQQRVALCADELRVYAVAKRACSHGEGVMVGEAYWTVLLVEEGSSCKAAYAGSRRGACSANAAARSE